MGSIEVSVKAPVVEDNPHALPVRYIVCAGIVFGTAMMAIWLAVVGSLSVYAALGVVAFVVLKGILVKTASKRLNGFVAGAWWCGYIMSMMIACGVLS